AAPSAMSASQKLRNPRTRVRGRWKAAGFPRKRRHCQRAAGAKRLPSLNRTDFCTIWCATRSAPMDVLTYSDTRANLKEVMDRVVEDRRPVVITRQKAEAVVMVSLADWNAMEETLHLLSHPRNAERLREAIAELEAGRGAEHDLIER